ncbi:hypothetical protein GCM10009785_11070 [Brooklawnia cerclae]|uniref:Uncharacterized protein n=1 Tax=Brooklawnia cerclae TaxID=349934 RepID=A0ABX0SL40_9ACTN|nr:hypothetical protein [Brooklawnia cerclae]NIH58664.1 hypothetical protein [Brooklawnia cerclae]
MGDKRWWPTMSEIAEDVRGCLAAGDMSRALRMLMDGVGHLPDADAAGRLDEALGEPGSTGDIRWDALLAGAVRYRLHRMGYRALPAWTAKAPLEKFWWPVEIGKGRALYDIANAPAELSRLGIFLSEKDFESA